MKTPLKFCRSLAVLGLGCGMLHAQPATPAASVAPKDETVVLSPFVVSSESASRYQATEATSGTRTRVSLFESPQSISVVTRDLIEDISAGRVVERQLEHEFGGRRHTQIPPVERRHRLKMFFDGLEDDGRIQVDRAHDFSERIPFDLRKREEQMLVGQERVVAAAGLFERPVDDSLRGLANLAW